MNKFILLFLFLGLLAVSSSCGKDDGTVIAAVPPQPLVTSTECLRGILYYHQGSKLSPVYRLSTRLRFAVPVACTKEDGMIVELED